MKFDDVVQTRKSVRRYVNKPVEQEKIAKCLETANLGLGTCWLGFFDEKEIKTLLEIPKGIRVAALTPLGYPHSSEGVWGKVVKMAVGSKKRKTLGEIAYDGKWGKPFGKP